MAENENPMRLFLLLISCFLSFRVSSASTTNTLHQADTLNSSQTLISAEGKFTLGFFNLKSSNKNYLCIWYTSSPTEPVWIANRNTPIPDDSGVLTMENTGKFLIKQDGGDSIELYSGETASNNSSNFTATLHDNGNFVLSVVTSDGSNGEVLWQSFDYPTDTLLPGMKLGVNLRTSKNWTLASWLSERDPSSGPYTLDWDSKGVQLVLKRRGVVFWTSGILKDQNQTFENIQKDSTWFENYNLFYDRNSDEEFFSYFLKNDSSSGSTNQTGSRWKIGFRGTVWFEENGLPLENMCYGYNTDSGCAEWTQPECRSNGTTFVVRSGDFVGLDQSNDQIFNQNESIGPADCRANCWNDCDCLGYRSNSNITCIMWRGKLQFKPDSTGSAPSINVINNRDDNIQKTKAGKKKWILVATIVPISLILAIIGFIVLLRRRHIKGNDMEELDSENDGSISGNLKVFSFVAISEATNDFSAENKLGEGGFGPVFKGKLPGGQEVAVKQLASTSKQGVVEFKNELALIGKLQHTNLVRLIGCCVRGEEKMLVYEYMPNKSLDSFIFDKSKRQLLDWRNWVNIIEGIAQGLLYLHQHSRLKIIHRDLKASNILLDADMNPKISDFGIARIFKQSELMARTNKVIGTYGYMSPEYAMEGIFSIKSDVFSFGVLVLEILSGRKNNRFYKPDEPLNLVGYAWELWQNGDILDLMDPILKESCYTHELVRYIHVGLLCVEDSPVDRPTISEVISMLANENIILPLLKKPAFLNLSDIEDSNGNKLVYHSENGVSFSTMEAR